MSRWNTQDIVDKINKLNLGTVITTPAEDECYTQEILVYVTKDEVIRLVGFNADQDYRLPSNQTSDDMDVEHVELCDLSSDSRGGIQSSYKGTIMAGAEITALLHDSGHDVVPNLRDYY